MRAEGRAFSIHKLFSRWMLPLPFYVELDEKSEEKAPHQRNRSSEKIHKAQFPLFIRIRLSNNW